MKLFLKLETITFLLSSFLLFVINISMKDIISNQFTGYLLLLLVVIFGLPHGALDTLIARKFKVYNNIKEFIIFNLLYISIALLVFIFWFYFSLLSLCIFLIISGYHFSEDWKINNRVSFEDLILGFSLINLPLLFHEKQVETIYFYLTSNSNIVDLIFIQTKLSYMNLVFILFILFKKSFRLDITLQIFTIIIFAYILEPLYFFISYFCFFHSIKNYKETTKILSTEKKINLHLSIFINTSLTLIIGTLIYYFFLNDFSFKNINMLAFIGLAALTVPHMILKSYINIKKK